MLKNYYSVGHILRGGYKVNKRSVKRLGISLIAFLLLFSTAFSNTYAAGVKKEKSSSTLTDKGQKKQNQAKKVKQKEGSLKDRINANQSKNKEATTKKVKKSKVTKDKTTTKTQKEDKKSTNKATNPSTTKKVKNVKANATEAKTDEIIVKFKADISANSVKDKFALKAVKKLNSIGAEVIKVPTGKKAESIIEALKADNSVLYAQPNYKYYSRNLPNDPLFSNLWGLHNTGQNGFEYDLDIDLPEALGVFNSGSTRNDLVVAVIDTGIDINHPELKNHIWVNPGETPNNGVDDDRNGFIDDVNGWDFYHNDNTVFDATDLDEHGTHVAGTIAASTNNGEGIAGIAPNVKIMPLKFIGGSGEGYTSDAILAIDYAMKMGVKVSNNSWGGGPFDPALYDAIKNSNSLFVAAAGNDALDNDLIPSYPDSFDLDNIISVAALNGYGELAEFSNYGKQSVDIAAPGDFIQSSIPKKSEFGAAAQIDNGKFKAIFNGFGFENITDSALQQQAFNKALEFLAIPANARILIVQDDQSETGDYEDYSIVYRDLLSNSGISYDLSEPYQVLTDENGPNANLLDNYDAVIWFTGDAFGYQYPTLTESDLQSLTTYLNGGGKLLLSGQDSLWRNTHTPFALDTLGINVINEQDRNEVVGVATTLYEGMTLPISGAYYADMISSNKPSTTKVNINYPADANYDNAYAFFGGTSMAAPHVTGVAALLYGLNPSLTAIQAKNILMTSGEPLDSVTEKVASGKALNAYNALSFDPAAMDNDVPGVTLESDVVTDTLDEKTDKDDVFAVKLNRGETIKAMLTGDAGTDFDLYLFDPYSDTVQDSTGMIIYSENQNTSNEYFEFTAYQTGTHYLDVYAYAGSGKYTLNVVIGNGPGEYENTSPSIFYEGYWTNTDNPNHSGGNAQSTNNYGSASFSFIGDEIEWIGFKDQNQGFADVYIDDKLMKSVSLYSSTLSTKVSLLKQTVPYGKHILKIVWTGKRDPLARKSGTSINVDKLIVRENIVAPLAPTNVNVKYDTFNFAPKVQWNSSTDASVKGYNIYRKASNESGFTLQNSTLVAYEHFFDRTAKVGANYEYYVKAVGTRNLESVASNTVSYVFDDNAPGLLMTGTSTTGSLTIGEDDLDVWAVQLEAGKTYSFSFNGPNGTDFDYVLFNSNTTNIFGENVEQIRYVEEIGSEEYFTYPVTQSGTYYVVPMTYEGSGNYSISIANKTTVADDDIPGVPLTGIEVSDFLDPFDIEDVYSVQLGKGDTITVNLSSPSNNGNDFDLYLYSPNATTVQYNSPEYVNSVAHSYNEDTSTEAVTYVADVAGKYFIDVSWFDGSGPYELKVNIVPSSNVGTIVSRIEDNDSGIKYTGGWSKSNDSRASGGTLSLAKGAAVAEYTFTGTGFRWIALKYSSYGIVDVYIDGQKINSVDLYSEHVSFQQVVYENLNLSSGSHTLRLVNTGTRNPASTGTFMNIDALEFIQPKVSEPTITKTEDTDTDIHYTGNWSISNDSRASGGTISLAKGTAVAEYTFTGSGFRWIALKYSSYGIVDVYIDGQKVNSVDLYSGNVSFQQVVYENLNLSSGVHTLKLVNTGTKNPASTGTFMNIDAFEFVQTNLTEPTISIIEDNDSNINFTGTWTKSNDSRASSGTISLAKGTSATVEYTFTGTGFRWIALKYSSYGIVDVYLDGQKVKTVDLYSNTVSFQQVVYENLNLSNSIHTVKLINTGTKNSLGTNTFINIDAFEIIKP
jgi:subtilisin family serine protease